MATAASDPEERTKKSWHPLGTVRWIVPILLLLAALLCLTIDLPVAYFFRQENSLKFMRELLENAEPFGHGVGVVYILLVILVLDERRRTAWGTLLLGSLGAGLVADALKLLVGRTRPRNLDLQLSSVWETFGGFTPLFQHAQGDSHSFPSSHTATAIGLAVILGTFYPRGQVLFFVFAALTGLQRVASSAHFPSDVCAGAAVGWVVAHFALILHHRLRGSISQ